MSITALIASNNKLPNITVPDTIFVMKNTNKTINFSAIDDGGEGNQQISIKAIVNPKTANVIQNISINYISPQPSGNMTLTPVTNAVGTTNIQLSVKDNAAGFFNEKSITIPVIVLSYINKAPNCNDIDDIQFEKNKINSEQVLMLTGVNDGNDGTQKISVKTESSNPSIVKVVNSGNLIKLTPLQEGTVTITVSVNDDGDTFLGGVNKTIKTFKVVVGSGITDNSNANYHFSIYPNPCNDKLYFKSECDLYNPIEIINAKGCLVKSIKQISGETLICIDCSDLQSGLYFISITTKHEKRWTHFIKN